MLLKLYFLCVSILSVFLIFFSMIWSESNDQFPQINSPNETPTVRGLTTDNNKLYTETMILWNNHLLKF